jgi:hypothetical protein
VSVGDSPFERDFEHLDTDERVTLRFAELREAWRQFRDRRALKH